MCDRDKLNNKVYQFDGFSFYSSIEQPKSWSNHSHQELQITLPQANAKAWISCPSSDNRYYPKRVEVGQSFLVAPELVHSLDWQQTAGLTIFYLHPRFFTRTIGDVVERRHLEIDHRFFLVDDALIQQIGAIFQYFCQAEFYNQLKPMQYKRMKVLNLQ